MTPQRIAEIEARAKAATEGPWGYNKESASVWWPAPETAYSPQVCAYIGKEDGEFCAHARQDIPDLLVEMKRLKAVFRGTIGALRDEGMHGTADRLQEFVGHD